VSKEQFEQLQSSFSKSRFLIYLGEKTNKTKLFYYLLAKSFLLHYLF